MIRINGFARKLVTESFFTEQKVLEIIDQAIANQMTFITYLIKQKFMPFSQLAELIAKEFNLPLLDFNAINLEELPLQLISEQLIRQHEVLPLAKQEQKIFLAISDPTNQATLDEIKFHTRLKPHCIIAAADKLKACIEKALNTQELSIFSNLTESTEKKLSTEEIEDVPVVRYVNKILTEAIDKTASDIHFEPYEKSLRVRFRIDGILYEIMSLPINLATRITARIKIMAQMDIAERRLPQDGRVKMNDLQGRTADFRVSTCPCIYGEKVVIRILDSKITIFDAETLGFESEQKSLFYKILSKPQGLVLVTGPTGSGKTITLYTALNILNTMQVNIVTVEDPVEIHLTGINQVPINPKAGLYFATALRAFLRQDPDILMVGEMRDLETAEIGIKAAQTGHLVLSTLHTNSAAETLTRLVSMGIANYNLATSAALIIAQRLARRLCIHCKREQKITNKVFLSDLAGYQVYGPVGCEHCTGGYKGRIAIFELLEVTENIAQLIMQNNDVVTIAQQAQVQGMRTLRESALAKVREGITSLAEINRVT